MSLTPWKNLPDTSTPINAENLINDSEYLDNKINEILETGSTSTGRYIKYNDGTVIQWGRVNLTPNESRSQGGLTYYSTSTSVILPIELFTINNASCSSNRQIANMNYFAQSYIAFVNSSTINLSFASTGLNDERIIDWLVIGRWK